MDSEIFKKYENTGVIYAMEEAQKYGYDPLDKDWVNLGQGSAQGDEIKGSPKRVRNFCLGLDDHGYAPVSGLKELKQKVAVLYNELFRQNHRQKYQIKNISIAGGGRIAISRVVASMNKVKLGFFTPDYTAYEGIINVFENVEPVGIRLNDFQGFKPDLDEFEKTVKEKKIQAFLLSNPCNPTGNVIKGKDLKKLIRIAKKNNLFLILDEFYFNYIYTGSKGFVSSARYISDIEREPILIIAGLSKALRYSGWRICWCLGPSKVIRLISSVGSFLDGGANHPLQKEAVKLLNKENIVKESKAVGLVFKRKRDFIKSRLEKIGFLIKNKPEGAFYIWASLENIRHLFKNDFDFFKQCLAKKVIVVPGSFFDIKGFKNLSKVKYSHYVRFSFGPDIKSIKEGMSRIEKLIKEREKITQNSSKWKLRSWKTLGQKARAWRFESN
ncbi:MAG: aminotransferase class I/II-fold pyridoxal phosphate-dependent enzyme [Candidatus Moranbacteria bacterium]|nr:aminotransferase class I/II-fold pyridoxal phosphate-dependent enzyme [Candidatus Moranbacteria bacterium]